MSIAATKWALDLRGVKPMPKLVLIVLADHADKFGGRCFPGLDTIAEETGLSRRAVIDNIKRLEEAGLLFVERRPGEGDGRRSNSYTLPIGGQGADSAHRGKVQLAQGQSADDAGQSAGAAPEPPENHQKEPPDISCDRFDEFWQAYPIKKSKQQAQKVWRRDNLNAIAQQLIDDVELRCRKDRQFLEGFAPHPSTYLNQQRWTDEIEQEKPHAKTRQRKSRADAARERLAGATGREGPGESRVVVTY